MASLPKSSGLKGIDRWGISLTIVTVAPSSDVSISSWSINRFAPRIPTPSPVEDS